MRRRIALRARALIGDRKGNALIEFAVAFPVLLTLYVGTYTMSDAIACNRKVTITTRALTDLATRYPNVTLADVTSILNASATVMSPYSRSNATIRLSEVKVTDATLGKATVVWSRVLNRDGSVTIPNGMTPGTVVDIPTDMAAAQTFLMLGQVQYTYTPSVKFGSAASFQLGDSILMLPRVSDEIPCRDANDNPC